MNQARVLKNAQTRLKTYQDLLNGSELTIVHQTPGEDHCCVDVPEALVEKKNLAKKMAVACIDAEISGHSQLWIVLHFNKIERLSYERAVIQTL